MAYTDPRTWTDGELVTAAIMNPHVRDNLDAMGPHLIVRKTADQSVSSSTTLVDDSDLVLPVGASEVWYFRFFLVYTAAAAGDLKYGFTFPTSGDLRLSVIAADSTGSITITQLSTTTSPSSTGTLSGATSYLTVPIEGVFVNSSTGGDLTLQWAQVTSSGTATTVKAHSTLWAVKLA